MAIGITALTWWHNSLVFESVLVPNTLIFSVSCEHRPPKFVHQISKREEGNFIQSNAHQIVQVGFRTFGNFSQESDFLKMAWGRYG